MRLPVLFRRREIWLPTLSGWALALIIATGALVWAGWQLHPFLAISQPVGARVLVVEGWMGPEELDQAVARFRTGNYTNVITTGSPVPADLCRNGPISYAELARDYLVRHGLPASMVTAVPAPESAKDRTFLSAVMVRIWLADSGRAVDALDVYSAGVHSRRTRAVYRLAFGPDVRIGILAAQPANYDPDAWWTTSTGAKTVMSELISWLWTELFFRPGERGSHDEK